MNILATQYTLAMKAFEVYVAGCSGNPHCKGCHNPTSWDFDNGEHYDETYKQQIYNKVKDFDSMIDNCMIFGGEPLDQNHTELKQLLEDLQELHKPIWIFTRYDIKEVPDFVKENCDYIKCGRYMEELKTENNTQYGITLATSNQHIYKKGVDY